MHKQNVPTVRPEFTDREYSIRPIFISGSKCFLNYYRTEGYPAGPFDLRTINNTRTILTFSAEASHSAQEPPGSEKSLE